MSTSRSSHKPPHIQLPNFEPLPPEKWFNRLINNLLKPIFYLLFTLVMSIVIVPVYTIIENFNQKSRAQRGAPRSGSHTGYTVNGQPVEERNGKMAQFLKDYGSRFDGQQHARTTRAGTRQRTH